MAERPKRPYPLRDAPFPPWADRLVAGLLIAAAVLVVWLLWQVDPDARGHGTHEQLGMAPCGWPSHYGIPCPTCGATTAAAHLVQLDPLQALWTQPFGMAAALAGIWAAGLAVYSLATRQSLLWRVAFLPMPRLLLWSLALLAASWGFKLLTWEDGPTPPDVLPPWQHTPR